MNYPDNPYASPQVEIDEPETFAPGDSGHRLAYRSAQGLGRTLRIVFWLLLLESVAAIPVGVWCLMTVANTWDAAEFSPAEWASLGVGITIGLTYLVSVVIYCKWKYRSYRNLQAFSDEGGLYSPGWAVGYYFVPIMNLFRPFQIMRELLNRSAGHPASNSSGLVNWWWGLFFLWGSSTDCPIGEAGRPTRSWRLKGWRCWTSYALWSLSWRRSW